MALRDWFWIIGLGFAWGSAFYFNEIMLRGLGPLTVAAARVGLGAIGCWAWVLVSGRSVAVPPGRMVELAVMGTFMFVMPFTIYPIAQQYVGASVAGIVNASTPVMTVIVSHFWPGGERASIGKAMGVAFGFSGIVMLMLPELGGGTPAFGAMLFMTIAPLCYAIALNWVRRFSDLHYSVLLTWALTAGGIVIAVLALAVEGVPAAPAPEVWISVLIAGLGLVTLAFMVFYWLYPRVGATNLSTVTFAAPVSAVLLGVLLLGERLSLFEVAGMVAIFCGIVAIDGRVLRWFRKA